MTFTFDLDPWPWPRPLTLTFKQGNSDVKTQFLAFGLDLWPKTLTYNPILAKVKVDPHAKNQSRRSNGSAMRSQTNGQTDRQTDPTKCIISLASPVDNDQNGVFPPSLWEPCSDRLSCEDDEFLSGPIFLQ